MSNPTPSLPAPKGNIVQQTLFRLRLIWRLMRDPRVNWLLKLIPIGGVGYLLLGPLDLVTDLIPVIGLTDDAGIILGSLWLFVELCPPDIVKEHMDDLMSITVKGTWKETEKDKLPEKTEEVEEKPQ
jgi:uncharacterized membrane protein YkvA (DUF1232 family)